MKEDNKNAWYWVVIAVLVVVIIILLFLSRCGKRELTPTGNVDVFNIDINDCGDSSKCENKDKNKEESKYPIWKDDEEHELDKVYIDDIDGNYIYHANLRIFENPYYAYTNDEGKIAPGVGNSYSFTVHNKSKMNIKYYVQMYKECDYDLDIKYRLKRNGKYVIGDENNWVSAGLLKTDFAKLNSGKDDKYVLDWKWEYEDGRDDKDTNIGENMTDAYKLNVKFYIEQAV